MTQSQDGGPAFPLVTGTGGNMRVYGGMTLRDYFAAKAMQGLICNPNGQNVYDNTKLAYAVADAMLLARSSK